MVRTITTGCVSVLRGASPEKGKGLFGFSFFVRRRTVNMECTFHPPVECVEDIVPVYLGDGIEVT